MTMNWGWKIFILYMGFAAMILTLVILSSREKLELVTTDYYKKEMAYQGIIDANQNAIQDEQHSQIDVGSKIITITFPNGSENQIKNILVYCVSTSEKDQNFSTTESRTTFPLTTGKYDIQISWVRDGTPYFEKKTVQIK
jgi:hypothetical protein